MSSAEPLLSEGSISRVPIGSRLQALLEQIQQSPAWLAERIGVPRSTISRAIKGERHPTPETLSEIAAVLGMPVAQLAAGTDAAERVKEAGELVSRKDYEEAVRQVIEYERKLRDASNQVGDLKAEAERQRESARRAATEAREATDKLAKVQTERDAAVAAAAQWQEDAKLYQEALERAVSDVAHLREQVRELGTSVGAGHQTARIGAILAGVAAAVSVATYLNRDAKAQPPKRPANARRNSNSEAGSKGEP